MKKRSELLLKWHFLRQFSCWERVFINLPEGLLQAPSLTTHDSPLTTCNYFLTISCSVSIGISLYLHRQVLHDQLLLNSPRIGR